MSRLTNEQAAIVDARTTNHDTLWSGLDLKYWPRGQDERARILDLKDELAARWQPIETATPDTPVAVRAGRMTFDAKLTLLDMGDEDQAYGWIAVHEGIHPPCWTDGRCWDVNEDGEPSAHPTHWMLLPEPPQ